MGRNEIRRSVDVERLLQWAFRDELPKQSVEGTWGYSVSPMFRLASLGVRVDEWSEEPGFPAALGACHPDALAIGQLVEGLDDIAVDWPGSRPHVIADFIGLVSDNDPTLSALVIARGALVGMHAKMGTRPHVYEAPKPEPVIGRNGKPVVQFIDDKGQLVEGRKGRHYGPAARCALSYWPSPRQVAFERLEYVVWHDTLQEIAETLNRPGMLGFHLALPSSAFARPWERSSGAGDPARAG